jgi:hypothetical protein
VASNRILSDAEIAAMPDRQAALCERFKRHGYYIHRAEVAGQTKLAFLAGSLSAAVVLAILRVWGY